MRAGNTVAYAQGWSRLVSQAACTDEVQVSTNPRSLHACFFYFIFFFMKVSRLTQMYERVVVLLVVIIIESVVTRQAPITLTR